VVVQEVVLRFSASEHLSSRTVNAKIFFSTHLLGTMNFNCILEKSEADREMSKRLQTLQHSTLLSPGTIKAKPYCSITRFLNFKIIHPWELVALEIFHPLYQLRYSVWAAVMAQLALHTGLC
jgi:hypothetical protein